MQHAGKTTESRELARTLNAVLLSEDEWLASIYPNSIFSEIQAPHNLIYIDQSDKVCIKQIAKRRTEQPERAATDTTEMFELVTRHFVAPTSNEEFNITVLQGNGENTFSV